jgi:alpha-beta hydrolase superfamily lysophospholipase
VNDEVVVMTTLPAPTPTSAPRHRTPEDGRRRHHWWRWVAGVVVIVLVAFLGAAWYFSGRIYSGALASEPFTWPPRYDDAVVVQVDAGTVTLDKGPDAGPSFDAPADYGLAWDGGTGYVGPATVVDSDTVTRELTLASGTAPTVGSGAAFERAYWLGPDPSALGYPWLDVTVQGPLGPLPAWYFPSATGDRTTTAVFVHGQNASRLDGLRVVDTLHRLGIPVLVITYRNDPGTAPDPSGRLGYGVTEWPDLEAAVSWATERGADDVVLAAQSMGAGVVASFLENSAQAGVVSKVVLDAPMLSLDQTVVYGARDAMPGGSAVPGPLVWAAEQVSSLRYGLDWGAVDYLDDTSWVTVPTLVVHGTLDPRIPVTESRELAAAVPELVTYTEFPKALHVESWNTDRVAWTVAVTAFLRSGT